MIENQISKFSSISKAFPSAEIVALSKQFIKWRWEQNKINLKDELWVDAESKGNLP